MLATLTVFGRLSLGCWWRVCSLGDVRLHLGAFYGWFAFAFLLYLLSLALIHRLETRGNVSQTWQKRNVPVAPIFLVVVVAGLARLMMLGTTPALSDDIYRYRWDGKVQAAGISPYAHPPNDPALASLRDAQDAKINFPHLRTVYPPLTEVAFRLGASIGPTLTAHKLVFLLAECLTALSLLVILWRRGHSLLWITAYAWHPLVILEIAGSGHNDALGIAMLWIGVAAYEARRWVGVTIGWSAAFLSKFLSVILLPWWWFRRTARGWLVLAVALAVVPLLWCFTCVTAVCESLSAMATRFESNSSVYLLLAWALGSPAAARFLSFAAAMAFLCWWARRETDPIRYLLGGLLAIALFSPVLHPWYVAWMIPCFCFQRWPAAMALSGAVVLAYTVWPGRLADGSWVIPAWAHVLEYALVGMFGIWGMVRCGLRSSFQLATRPSRSGTS